MNRQEAGARLATRVAFFVAGFGLACWAPLVPLAKARLAVSDATLGLLILCLGLGSVLIMQVAGPLVARWGPRPAIILGGIGQGIVLPALSIAPNVATMATALLLFGGFLGLIDVSMNVHALEVEKRTSSPLMSGFHGLFSFGGGVGSLFMSGLLSLRVSAVSGTITAALLMICAMVLVAPRFIATPRAEQSRLFVIPRGIVVLLAALAAIAFLTEGAMLDWGALLLSGEGLLPAPRAGIGFGVFCVAMMAGRLTGDAVTARLGDRRTILWGGSLAVLGYAVLLTAPVAAVALAGILLIGLGSANVVPILFRLAGSQSVMPAGHAIAAVTTVGYAGVLAGPAGVGFVAQAVGLHTAFWILAAMICTIPLSAGVLTRSGRAARGI